MKNPFAVGIVGTIVTAICCFTPLLPWLFSAIGALAVLPYLDWVLLPLLAVFFVMTAWGLIKRQNEADPG